MAFDVAQMKHSLRFLSARFSPSITENTFYSKYNDFVTSGVMPLGWKEKEIKLLREKLTEDSVFIDIGANVGVYTYIASKIVGEDKVIAFEPMPDYCHYLRRMFPKTRVEQIALSESTGTNKLKVPAISKKKFTARATLNTEFVEEGEEVEKSVLYIVETATLDDYLESNNISRLDMMKIDVEGHEHKVLLGAQKTIKRFKPTIIVEIEQRHHEFDIEEIIENVCSLGYHCSYYSNDTNELTLLNSGQLRAIQDMTTFGSSQYINNFIFEPR